MTLHDVRYVGNFLFFIRIILFSLQVMGAKIVTYARTPGVRCFGYITMATSEDASKCIQYLHRTEIHGRMISVERVRSVGKCYGLFTRGISN